MLHALKEGVVAVDAHGEVNLINSAAEEILFSGPDKTLVHSPLLDDLQTVLQSGEPMYDRELGCNGLLLIGNTVPIRSQVRWSAPSVPSAIKLRSANCCSDWTA